MSGPGVGASLDFHAGFRRPNVSGDVPLGAIPARRADPRMITVERLSDSRRMMNSSAIT